MDFIDAHVHIWTSDTAHYPLAPGYKKEDMKPASFTPEELFRHSQPHGVNRINLIQMSYYGFDNSYMIDMIALHPEVFVGTAIIDPLGDDPRREMIRLARHKVRAFRIYPDLSQQPVERWLEPAGFAKMFDTGARENLAISCLIGPDALPELDRMCRRFPETPVIIDHMARIGIDGEIREKEIEALCAMARHKKVMVKVGAFYALGRKRPPYEDLAPLIKRVVRAFTSKRCMWESDCPFQVMAPHTYADSINLVRRRLSFLTDEDRDYLLRRTAEEFFFRS